MHKKFILTILTVILPFFIFAQTKVYKDKCETLKQQKIDFSQTDVEHIHRQIFKLTYCGFDSIDCKIAAPIIATIMVNKSNQKGDTTIEYSYIVDLLNQLKKSPEYAQIRRETIYGKKIEKKVPAFLSIHQFFDYQEGKQYQTSVKKPLLIYFTGKYNVTSRKMEDVLSDTSIISLLNDFIIVTLYVDDEKVGKMNAEFQESKYKGNTQPEFIKQTVDGKWKSLSGLVSKEEFIEFLNL